MHTYPVNIDLIGVGGGGSLVLSGLVRLHLAMKSLVGCDQTVYRKTAIFFFLHIFDPETIVSSGMPYLLHGAGFMPEYSLIKIFRNVCHIFFQGLLPVDTYAAWQADSTV